MSESRLPAGRTPTEPRLRSVRRRLFSACFCIDGKNCQEGSVTEEPGRALSEGVTQNAVGTGGATETASSSRQPGSRPYPDLPAGTDTIPKIEHIVVLMMENHSYDNKLGMLS